MLGTAHSRAEQGCQDYHLFETLAAGAGRYFIALAADGAGSAPYGELGAELACKAAFDYLKAALAETELAAFDAAAGTACLTAVRDCLRKAADARHALLQDLACTLATAVIGTDCAFFMQVGDGAMIASVNGCRGVVFWPEAGPYANMTHFVTDPDGADRLQTARAKCRVDELAVLTDGLQRLVLSFDARAPHDPFFEPLFETLAQASATDCIQLQRQLGEFLNLPKLNERTDDDKTLILAVRASP